MNPPENTLIKTAVDEWIEYNRDFKRKTLNHYRSIVFNFIKALPKGADTTVEQLNNGLIEDYLKILKSKYAPQTFRIYKSCFRSFFYWLSQQYGIKVFISRGWQKLKPIPVLRAVDETNVVSEWLNHNKRHSPNTQKDYRRHITRFVEFSGIESIDQLHSRHIESYLSNLLSSGLKNSTVNAHRVCLKSFCKWLSRNYDVPNYTKGIQKLREEPFEPRVITQDEYLKLLAVVCPEQNRDVIRFLGNTGLRVSELLNIKWRDIRPDYKMLTVSNGKGRKKRYVPLNSVCQEIVKKNERGPDESRADFISYWKNRKSIYIICAGLSARSGIPTFGPHALRHYFATQMLRKGVPIIYVARILGHADVQITQRTYEHFLLDDFDGMTDCLLAE